MKLEKKKLLEVCQINKLSNIADSRLYTVIYNLKALSSKEMDVLVINEFFILLILLYLSLVELIKLYKKNKRIILEYLQRFLKVLYYVFKFIIQYASLSIFYLILFLGTCSLLANHIDFIAVFIFKDVSIFGNFQMYSEYTLLFT